MEFINEGLTAPQYLTCLLEFKYSFTSEDLECISKIENHKGVWEVTFNTRPSLRLVLITIAIFENEFSYDYLDAIIYNTQRFEGLADSKSGFNSLIALLEMLRNEVEIKN